MSEAESEMKLTAIIQEWLNEMEWEDEVVIDHVEMTSQVSTGVTNDGTSFKLYLEADEKKQWLSVYLYSTIEIPLRRFADACVLANDINLRLGLGRFVVHPDKRIQFKAMVDVEGCEPTVVVLRNLMGSGEGAFTRWINAFGKLIFTDASPEQIVKEIIDAENASAH